MVFDESIFVNKRAINTIVTVANGEKLRARFIGDIRTDLSGQMIKIKIVLCMSRLHANPLSISALNRRGLAVLFNNFEAFGHDPNPP